MWGAAIAVFNKQGIAGGRRDGVQAGDTSRRLLGIPPLTYWEYLPSLTGSYTSDYVCVTSPVPLFRVKVPLVALFVLIYSFHSANQTDFLPLFKYLYMCVTALCLDSLQSRQGNKEQTISVR